MQQFTVTFFGHRYIVNLPLIEDFIYNYIRNLLIEKEYVEFLVGRNGDFDQIVSSTVRKIKRDYRDDNSSLVLVLPYSTAEYLNNEESFANYYDNIEISCKASKSHPKAAIQTRNKEMVERADLIICYVEKPFGGAYNAMEYASKQNKCILNIYEHLSLDF